MNKIEKKQVAYRYDTTKYRNALNNFIENEYIAFLARAKQEGGDYSIELFRTGKYRVLKGRVGNKKGVQGRGWIIPLFEVNVNDAIETLNKELSYSRNVMPF